MLKKLLLAAAIAAPSLAFAGSHGGHHDVVIRVNSPVAVHDYVQYRPQPYRRGNSEQRQRISWVNAEQERQRDRLIQGVRSGELTSREAQRLQQEQAQIRSMEQRYLSDRHLSRGEFDNIQKELRESSQHIQAQKHDREDRDRDRYSYNRW